LHLAHRDELPVFLAVQQLSMFVQHGQRRHALVHRNLIPRRQIQIHVLVPDVHPHQNEIALQNGPVGRIVKVDVQHLAVAAPVAAKIEQNPLMRRSGGP